MTDKWLFVPKIENTDAPTLTELTGTSVVDFSECVMPGVKFTPGSAPTKLLDDFSWPPLEYVYDPDGSESLAWLDPAPTPLYVYNSDGERVGIVESFDRVDDNGLDITIVSLPRLWGGDQA